MSWLYAFFLSFGLLHFLLIIRSKNTWRTWILQYFTWLIFQYLFAWFHWVGIQCTWCKLVRITKVQCVINQVNWFDRLRLRRLGLYLGLYNQKAPTMWPKKSFSRPIQEDIFPQGKQFSYQYREATKQWRGSFPPFPRKSNPDWSPLSYHSVVKLEAELCCVKF